MQISSDEIIVHNLSIHIFIIIWQQMKELIFRQVDAELS